ncbi:MAG: hypothetical protein HOI95_20635 [Chromatiales bacterium]|jgi:uncharacterized membrane protein|nr:hypothetical protein [Chromatiales bacterium]
MANISGAKNIATLVYALQAAGFLTGGITIFIAIVVSYIKRDVAYGTWLDSHVRWQIATFWWNLLGTIVGTGTVFLLGLGYVVLAVVWVWLIYRIAKGWLRLIANESM